MSEQERGAVQERIKRLENKKRLIICGASSGLQPTVRNAIFLTGTEELANDYSSSDSLDESKNGTPASPTNVPREVSWMVGDESSKKNMAIRKALSQLEKKAEAKALKNRDSRVHKASDRDKLVKPPDATFTNNGCISTPPPTQGFRFVTKKYPQEKGELVVPVSHPQVGMKTVKIGHLSAFQPDTTSFDTSGFRRMQNNCHQEEMSESVDMNGAVRTLCSNLSSTHSAGILLNSSTEADHEKFSHTNDAWDPPLST